MCLPWALFQMTWSWKTALWDLTFSILTSNTLKPQNVECLAWITQQLLFRFGVCVQFCLTAKPVLLPRYQVAWFKSRQWDEGRVRNSLSSLPSERGHGNQSQPMIMPNMVSFILSLSSTGALADLMRWLMSGGHTGPDSFDKLGLKSWEECV